MLGRALILCLATAYVFGCKGTEGATGPRGPSGAGTKVVSVNAYAPTSTTSTSVQPIPQMSLTLSLDSASTVVVSFGAEMYLSAAPTSGGNGIVVNILVDGSALVPAVSYTASPYYGAYSYIWSVGLPAGQHVVAANWNLCGTGCTGLTGYAAARELTVWWVR